LVRHRRAVSRQGAKERRSGIRIRLAAQPIISSRLQSRLAMWNQASLTGPELAQELYEGRRRAGRRTELRSCGAAICWTQERRTGGVYSTTTAQGADSARREEICRLVDSGAVPSTIASGYHGITTLRYMRRITPDGQICPPAMTDVAGCGTTDPGECLAYLGARGTDRHICRESRRSTGTVGQRRSDTALVDLRPGTVSGPYKNRKRRMIFAVSLSADARLLLGRAGS